MKKSLLLLMFVLTGFYSDAQTLNEQLYEAVQHKDTLRVENLLSKGADANYKEKKLSFETGLLITAVLNNDYKTVKLLIDHKVEVNWKDWFHTTALMYAASKGNLDIIKYLLKSGADINAKDEQGNTVLSAAKESNRPEVVKFIEELMTNH